MGIRRTLQYGSANTWTIFTVGFGASAQDGFGTSVFQEHREFFLTYRLPDEQDLKAALRWRYAFRTVDAETGKEYTPAEVQSLPEKQRWLLTTKPLGGEQIQTLLNTAIAVHARAMEELRESRCWIPVFAAILGFVGAILGVILSALLHLGK